MGVLPGLGCFSRGSVKNSIGLLVAANAAYTALQPPQSFALITLPECPLCDQSGTFDCHQIAHPLNDTCKTPPNSGGDFTGEALLSRFTRSRFSL